MSIYYQFRPHASLSPVSELLIGIAVSCGIMGCGVCCSGL